MSLVEMMVVTAFLLIVTASLWSMLDSGLKVQMTVNDTVLAQDNARLGLEQMVKEIRAVKNWSESSPMTDWSLQFVKVSDVANESHIVTFTLDRSDENRQQLIRTDVKRVSGVVVSTTADVIADYIINSDTEPMFIYYDAFQHQLTTDALRPGLTRRVNIHLIVKTNRNSAVGEADLSGSAAMRN